MADAPQRSNRTFWDWLHLLLPSVILLLGITWLSVQQGLLAQQTNDQQRATALQIAHAQQQASILMAYQESITDMLLHNDLLHARQTSIERLVAQIKTAEVLRQLDGDGKGALLRFLYETKLINNDTPIISLRELDAHGANLRNVDLRDTNLFGIDLHSADVRGANLSFAAMSYVNLTGANLAGSDLHGSDMRNANLSGANLSGANLKDVTNLTQEQLAKVKTLSGAIMLDGSIHH
ncbi:MAG: pentapeptide repeat-containing protein [Ktedonobacteraceae bacterium]|nr:pentapeptide repeat-containing protein [Ktedonobacteraceae bacterium]MBO0791953.1 pentapeptide repeat-containing protein [Ktedonobacteraceae bacterium]